MVRGRRGSRRALTLIVLAGLAFLAFAGWRHFAGREPAETEPRQAETEADFAAALAAYAAAIRANDPDRVKAIPAGPVAHPVTQEDVRFRDNAARFFAATGGRAVTGVSAVGNVFAALESPTAGDAIAIPARLVVWHNTNHYTGVSVVLVDDRGEQLAEAGLPEIAHWNILLDRLEFEVEYDAPTAPAGFVRVYATGVQDGEGSELLFQVPVVLGRK